MGTWRLQARKGLIHVSTQSRTKTGIKRQQKLLRKEGFNVRTYQVHGEFISDKE
jgi:hypothetical protein